ncbi:MAG: hypothetical protein ABEJ42_03155 [Halobacteriaceae archaeon]
MYHAIFPDGRITCETYDRVDDGVECRDGDGGFLAFVPYENLHALVDEQSFESAEAPPFVA